MAESDLVKLYSGRILQLATELSPYEPLTAPHGVARKRSPLCGSTVSVEVKLDQDGRISEFSQNVKACALGQASASILENSAIGRSAAEISDAFDQLEAMLKTNGKIPDAPFDELEVLIPAKDFKNRHASILLALDATRSAIQEASTHQQVTASCATDRD